MIHRHIQILPFVCTQLSFLFLVKMQRCPWQKISTNRYQFGTDLWGGGNAHQEVWMWCDAAALQRACMQYSRGMIRQEKKRWDVGKGQAPVTDSGQNSSVPFPLRASPRFNVRSDPGIKHWTRTHVGGRGAVLSRRCPEWNQVRTGYSPEGHGAWRLFVERDTLSL